MIDNTKWNKESIGQKEKMLGTIFYSWSIIVGLGRPERFFLERTKSME